MVLVLGFVILNESFLEYKDCNLDLMEAIQNGSKRFIKLSRGLRIPNDDAITVIHKANSLRACVISEVPVSSWKLEIELTRLDVFHNGGSQTSQIP